MKNGKVEGRENRGTGGGATCRVPAITHTALRIRAQRGRGTPRTPKKDCPTVTALVAALGPSPQAPNLTRTHPNLAARPTSMPRRPSWATMPPRLPSRRLFFPPSQRSLHPPPPLFARPPPSRLRRLPLSLPPWPLPAPSCSTRDCAPYPSPAGSTPPTCP